MCVKWNREGLNCHCSRLTTWQLVLSTCSVKRLTLTTVCHWSRLTVWTHSQLLITHISALHFTLVLCNCPIPQCSQLTDFSHALHAIPSVLTTYGRLWPQLIFSAMQMLCTDKVYRERRRCQELNAIEADSLTEQVLKRSIFKHIIEAGSLCWTHSLKRLTLTTPLKQTHCVKHTHRRG